MKNVKKKIAIVTSLIFLFCCWGSTRAYAYYKTPVSYLSLDINPSVEFGVNAFGKVVKAEGYNDDGKKVLEGIDVTFDNVKEAVSAVITSASDNGYVESDGSTVVAITSETDNPDLATEIQTFAEDGINDALDENGKQAVIQKDNVPLSLNKEAREIGITPGKLNIIRKLQELDPTATIDQYKDASVKTIMKDIKKNTDNGAKGNKATSIVEEDTSSIEEETEGTVDNKTTDTVNNNDNGKTENKNVDKVNNKDNSDEENKAADKVNNNDNGKVENEAADKVNNNDNRDTAGTLKSKDKANEDNKGTEKSNKNEDKKDIDTENVNKQNEDAKKNSDKGAVEKQKIDNVNKGNKGNNK